MVEININPKQLYEGSMQAAITHAVAVGMYPELNHEHSWDGIYYCVNDSQGCKAAITFHNKYVIAVFQAIDKADGNMDALAFFDGAPEEIREILAGQYTFQGASGLITFNSMGDPIKTAYISTWTDGLIETISTINPTL
jgi:hypothetical protein